MVSGEEGDGAEEEELILVRQVSEEVEFPVVFAQERSSVVVDLTHVISRGILDVPVGAAGETAAGTGDSIGLGAVEGGDFQSFAARNEKSETVDFHGTKGLLLSVGNGILRVASTAGAE